MKTRNNNLNNNMKTQGREGGGIEKYRKISSVFIGLRFSLLLYGPPPPRVNQYRGCGGESFGGGFCQIETSKKHWQLLDYNNIYSYDVYNIWNTKCLPLRFYVKQGWE